MLISSIKQHHKAILFTAAIHIGLLAILSMQSFDLPLQETQDVKPIKSYLYIPTAPKDTPKPEETKLQEDSQKEIKPKPQESPPQLDDKSTIPQAVEEPDMQPKAVKQSPNASDSTQPKREPAPKQLVTPKKNTSVRAQLFDLQKQIQTQTMQEEFAEYQRYRQGDVMAGKHIPVPHSKVPQSEDEKLKQATSNVGSFDIIKGDDGNCLLVEDLSYLGLDHKPVSSFGCGLTKDEKNFKQHMDKVLKRLGKKK